MDKQKKELQTKGREKKTERNETLKKWKRPKGKKIEYWREGRKKIKLKMFSNMQWNWGHNIKKHAMIEM